MKTLRYFILFLLLPLTVHGAHVRFNIGYFTSEAAAYQPIKITPSPTNLPAVNGSQIITGNPKQYPLNSSGQVTVSNMAAITYICEWPALNPTTTFQITVPATNGFVDATNILTTVSNIANVYTVASVDSLLGGYVAKNGTPTNGQVLIYDASSGLFWPSNSASGIQTNAFPTASATTKSGSTNSFIGGGESNRIAGAWALIMGGKGNTNGANFGFIGGGQNNTNRPGSTQGGAIVAGFDNSNESWQGFIGAGNHNVLMAAEFATIVGGSQNIVASGQASVIVAGEDNYLESEWSFIGGGNTNRVELGTDFATLVGGKKNTIGGIGGTGGGQYAFLGGGQTNFVNDDYASIVGGQGNRIDSGGTYGGILGGRLNFLNGGDSMIIGSHLTNTLANSVDIGGSEATKASISLTGSVFRTPITAPSVTTSGAITSGDLVTGTNFQATGVTASRATYFDNLKRLTSSAASGAELDFLAGVTAPVQTQFTAGTNNVAGLRTAFNTLSNNFLAVSNAHVSLSNQVTTLTAAENASSNSLTTVSNNASVGYTLGWIANVALSSPADSTTYYPMDLFSTANIDYTNAFTYIPKNGTLKWWEVRVRMSTVGTSEAVQHYLRLNNSTDVGRIDMDYSITNRVAFTNLSQAVTTNDTLAFKVLTPAWVGNPASVRWIVNFYIEP